MSIDNNCIELRRIDEKQDETKLNYLIYYKQQKFVKKISIVDMLGADEHFIYINEQRYLERCLDYIVINWSLETVRTIQFQFSDVNKPFL